MESSWRVLIPEPERWCFHTTRQEIGTLCGSEKRPKVVHTKTNNYSSAFNLVTSKKGLD